MELPEIAELLPDRPYAAQAELKRWLHYHDMTPEAAELKLRIEGIFAADAAEPQPDKEDFTDR